jgi:hypothetical protein
MKISQPVGLDDYSTLIKIFEYYVGYCPTEPGRCEIIPNFQFL